ncbi:HtaA domain-containing protein [Citricoccus sp. NPDC079358]|uniref:HtaA domain-containing protein n=1 Tax=Citricoccus sp. NPDC079358 TaxID=3154653 RepID=UPI0034507CDB
MNHHIVRSGALGWGIKDSFRGYLSRQADFSLNVDDGASVGAGNAVQFPLVEDRSEDVVWATRGHAVFRAHGGMMRLSLRNPVVRLSGADLVMAFDVGSGPQGAEPDYFEVARLVEVPSEDPRQRAYRTFLLPDATGMFNDMYDADSELDAVTVTTEVMS